MRESRTKDKTDRTESRGTKQPNPESSLLTLRAHIKAYANIRPCQFYSKALLARSPLKPEIAEKANFIVLRENCGGAYYGDKIEQDDYAMDPWGYTTPEIERVARVAAALAQTMGRDGHGKGGPATVWSADKANVLANSRLWRRVVTRVFEEEFPGIELKHQLADSLSMIMMTHPSRFNGVILTDNTFGDMLSDQAGGVVGTLGVLPSASLCAAPLPGQRCNGIYEPVHGSAPDISGQGIANPLAQILSAALMLRYSCDLHDEATLIETAVAKVLDSKDAGGLEIRTRDMGGTTSTTEAGDAVCRVLEELLSGHAGSGTLEQDFEKSGHSTAAHGEENKAWEKEIKKEAVTTGPQTSLALS